MASDTIAAIATPPGRGGIGIVRVSGPRVPLVAETLLGKCPPARSAHRASFRDGAGEAIDDGLALYFPAPHSLTGEHVLERSLSGEFSECVNSIVEAVTDLRAQIEASIDFPDEDADFLGDGEVAARVTRVLAELDHLAASARQGALLRDGLVVVIAGAPNAGKSSLLNRLAGHDAAIVTEVAGTTRDVLREDIVLDGLPVRIIDTAGLREAGDAVEQEGVRRARAEIVRADHVLMVVDATQPAAATPLDPELAERPLTIVRNKIDLSGEPPGAEIAAGHSVLRVSAKTGAGLDALRAHLQAVAGWTAGGGTFSARRRHLDALTRARRHVADGYEALETRHAAELCAEELRLAQQALGEITGAFTTEDLLGRIFTSFCIGK
ncbi:MAG: tRNA modification GTPase [Xanthomonadaceae bacterium]|nr:tRNA modification GTPase [Xanthomonadaceae bacterium]